MKNDIDSLMQANDLDAILVIGSAQHNPPMVYQTGIHHITQADLIKKRGEPPLLIHPPMERDEAARTGLNTRLMDLPFVEEYLRMKPGDTTGAMAARYKKVFTDIDLTAGRVGLYGGGDVGRYFAIFSELRKLMPEIELVGETNRSVILSAMETKDTDEIEHIRTMGQLCVAIMGDVADFITSHQVKDEIVVKKDGSPLTVGDVKQKIDLWVAERGAENPEGTIFAIGYDASVPHSAGIATDPLRLGKTIVYDFFPQQAGGGYYYDITRTWCLGYAPDQALELYEDVFYTYREVKKALRVGAPCRDIQNLACDLFEARGHPTIRTNPTTTEGYVHSLGHGVGLYIHELPFLRSGAPENERLLPGMVHTIEPGLYYPSRGMGVRLEDTVAVRPDGVFETLADFPLDLVLPMKK
jgi:Xaa-Pro aminopeptidase